MRKPTLLSLLAAVLVLGVCASAAAGGPYYVDEVNKTGVAKRWQGNAMTWYVDKGALSDTITNQEGIDLITAQLAKWSAASLENADRTSVQTISFSSAYGGKTGSDITVENYETTINQLTSGTLIIFDKTGDITAREAGESNRNSVIGLSTPLEFDSSGLYITAGVIIMNGYPLDNGVLDEETYTAALLHELGHVINLDHTQVNNTIGKACATSASCSSGNVVPTMYPILVSHQQSTLKIDDIITASLIYPNVSDASKKFHTDFAMITGAMYDKNGAKLKGVNVIAMRCDGVDSAGDCTPESTAQIDARSMVSGVMYPNYDGESTYFLAGLVPNRQYKVICEPIDSAFTGMSGLEPIDDPPTGFSDCVVQTTGGATTVTPTAGGQVIEMAATTVDVESTCEEAVCGDDDGGSAASSSGSKACSLIPGGGASAGGLAYLVAAAVALIAFRRRRP